MRLILYDIRTNVFIYLFIFIQAVVIIFTLNCKISSIMNQYERNIYMEDYDKDLWVYEGYLRTYDGEMGSEKDYIELLKETAGVQDIGYYEMGFFYVRGLLEKNSEVINEIYYVTPVMERIKSRLAQGSWFEKDSEKTEFIIGGDIAKYYQVGDTITIQETDSDRETEGTVRGILQEHAQIPCLAGESGTAYTLSGYSGDNLILTNDETVLQDFEYTMIQGDTLILSMKDASEKNMSVLREKGKLYSLEEAVKNARTIFYSYLRTTISKNILLLGVILFGVTGCTCLLMWRRKKEIAVYYLLGKTEKSMMIEMTSAVAGIFLAAILLIRIFYKRLAADIYMGEITWYSANTVFSFLICFFLILVNSLMFYEMCRKTPKQMLTEAKEEMA